MRRVVEAVALYADRNELKAEYPGLEDEDIQQALECSPQTILAGMFSMFPILGLVARPIEKF